MPCIDANGNLTRSAELILLSMIKPNSIEASAKENRMPIYRIRSAVRELGKAGLIEPVSKNFQTTEKGIEKLEGRK